MLLLLLMLSASVNTFAAYRIVYSLTANPRRTATLGVVFNLFLLILFKYGHLIGEANISSPNGISHFLLTLPLPIGISFYTFEGISLLVDTWKGRLEERRPIINRHIPTHITNTLFFISFFPHLIAGPILRASQFLPQIETKALSGIDWNKVIKNLILGYFLKMVIADNLQDLTHWMTFPQFESQSGLTLLVLLFGYSIQIFADFAGYSFIALGIAEIFGYRLIRNFHFPYLAVSFRDFWKRWNISLSSFLMEYLYIPLGGSRKGRLRTYFNLLLTMILGGLWHGGAWSYAVWGSCHGLALVSERFIKDQQISGKRWIPRWLKGLFVFSIVTWAWLLFRLTDFSQAVLYTKLMFSNLKRKDNSQLIAGVIIYSLPVILYHLLQLFSNKWRLSRFYIQYQIAIYGILLFLIIVNSGPPGTFIYFQF